MDNYIHTLYIYIYINFTFIKFIQIFIIYDKNFPALILRKEINEAINGFLSIKRERTKRRESTRLKKDQAVHY